MVTALSKLLKPSISNDISPRPHLHFVEYANFWTFLESHPLVLMQFWSPRCPRSRNFAPIYDEAAKQLAFKTLPRPVTLAKYDDSTESQRQLRSGAEDGNRSGAGLSAHADAAGRRQLTKMLASPSLQLPELSFAVCV
jgi:hypothetical protein